MLRFPKKRRARPTIHLTALIDIVFLLLIFFLLASKFIEQQGITINVPEVESENAELTSDIVVKIDHKGTMYFKGRISGDRYLLNALRFELRAQDKDTVIIQADRHVQYEYVVQAIDLAKLAGAKNLLLVTEHQVKPD